MRKRGSSGNRGSVVGSELGVRKLLEFICMNGGGNELVLARQRRAKVEGVAAGNSCQAHLESLKVQ